MQLLRDFLSGLDNIQRTIIIVVASILAIGFLVSFVFYGTDYSGFGNWITGWF